MRGHLSAGRKAGEATKAFTIKDNPAMPEEDIAWYCQQNLIGDRRPK